MSQSYANHRRYYAWHHFVVQPILLINVAVEVARLNKYRTIYHVWLVVFALAIVILSLTARSMALRAQNRVIRLEERLRLARILPPGDQAIIDKLSTSQLIALRFASDDELADLARKAAAGEFSSPGEIKKSIRNWRPDHLRV
jgi:hypothetical protein